MTVAVTLAGLLAWQSIVLLADRNDAATKFRLDAWLARNPATMVVVVLAVAGLAMAGAILWPRTRQTGAVAAAVGLGVRSVYLAVMWFVGDPVECLCGTAGRRRGWFSHAEAIVVIVAAAGVAGFVAFATARPSRRRSSE